MKENLEHLNQESYEIPLPDHIKQMLLDSSCDFPNIILKYSPENFHTIRANIPLPNEVDSQSDSLLIHPAIEELAKISLSNLTNIPILLFETQPSSQEEAYELALEATTQLDLAIRLLQGPDLPGPYDPDYTDDFEEYFAYIDPTPETKVTNKQLKAFLKWRQNYKAQIDHRIVIPINKSHPHPDAIFPQVFTQHVPKRQIRYSQEIAIVLARKNYIGLMLSKYPAQGTSSTKKTSIRKQEVPVCPIHAHTSAVNFMINSPNLKP